MLGTVCCFYINQELFDAHDAAMSSLLCVRGIQGEIRSPILQELLEAFILDILLDKIY